MYYTSIESFFKYKMQYWVSYYDQVELKEETLKGI